MKDIKMLESTFNFRPICLRNIRISTTLLHRAARAGLNLEQIGQILCRPDDDDTQPSLLERIIDKARLIADMMMKLQSNIKDSNLRNIDSKKNGFDFDIPLNRKKDTSSPHIDKEEYKFGEKIVVGSL